jgi:hypothetical protein
MLSNFTNNRFISKNYVTAIRYAVRENHFGPFGGVYAVVTASVFREYDYAAFSETEFLLIPSIPPPGTKTVAIFPEHQSVISYLNVIFTPTVSL